MTIIAFVTEATSTQRIFEHIGKPTTPPPISPAGVPNGHRQEVSPLKPVLLRTRPELAQELPRQSMPSGAWSLLLTAV